MFISAIIANIFLNNQIILSHIIYINILND